MLLILDRPIMGYIHFENNPEECKAIDMLMNAFCRYSPKWYIRVNDRR